MSTASNVNTIQQDIARIKGLIDETTTLLHAPASTIAADMTGYLQNNASKLAAPIYSKFRTLTSSGKKEAVIVGGAILGGLYLGALAIDGVRNLTAYSKAKNQLSAYHQQLSVKSNLLIEEQQKLIAQLSKNMDLLEEDRNELIQTLGLLSNTLEQIKAATAARQS